MNQIRTITTTSLASALTCAAMFAAHAPAGESPYAVAIESYVEGTGVGDYNNASAALGEPTRFTGADEFPAIVSAFNSPWIETEIVSIGPGGHLTVKFDSPIEDNPHNPFGIDLLIFNNTMFFDIAWPSGVVGGLFSDDGGIVEVSEDGKTWHLVRKAEADGLFPTIGYLDAGPYDVRPGNVESDFRKPVDPSLTFDDFLGLNYQSILELYGGSGGGAGIDIGSVGLAQASYVRISNPSDAFLPVQIDAFAKVRPILTGDLDGNGTVNVFDLLLLLGEWGPCPSAEPEQRCDADLDGDGAVNVFDLLMLLANWG